MYKTAIALSIFFTAFILSPSVTLADGSQAYSTPGAYTFTVPSYGGSLTVQVWGGGGGGDVQASASAGGSSSFRGMTATGGGGAYVNAGGAGGTASGGSVNLPGSAGGDGPGFTGVGYTYVPSVYGGTGGASPNGGAGGAGGQYYTYYVGAGGSAQQVTVSTYGADGNTPGAGGGGGMLYTAAIGWIGWGWGQQAASYGFGGGGGGGYTSYTYAVNDLTPGSQIAVTVGAGGAAQTSNIGQSGTWYPGNGAPGKVLITWTDSQPCTLGGNPVANGGSVTAYQASIVSSPATCVSQTRTCTNGTLSGTYVYPTCTVAVDTCTDIAGTQVTVPTGCIAPTPAGSSGLCTDTTHIWNGTQCTPPDLCTDIAGTQVTVPTGCIAPTPAGSSGLCTDTTHIWNGSQCTPPVPTLATFIANPSRVHNGSSTLVAWAGTNLSSCVLSTLPAIGGANSGIAYLVNGATGGNASIGPITAKTIITLSCVGGTLSQSITITLVPTVIEI